MYALYIKECKYTVLGDLYVSSIYIILGIFFKVWKVILNFLKSVEKQKKKKLIILENSSTHLLPSKHENI